MFYGVSHFNLNHVRIMEDKIAGVFCHHAMFHAVLYIRLLVMDCYAIALCNTM